MTTTDFDTDVDQALVLSHDFDPACEGPLEPKCGLPAQIIVYMKCGCFWMLSRRCRNSDRNAINKFPPGTTHQCPRCGCEFGEGRWGDLVVDEVPL